MKAYLFLLIAIAGEVIGTSALKASDGMTKMIPSIVVVIGYAMTFYTLSIALKSLPVGVVYAIWSGLGIVSIVIIGICLFNECFTWMHFLGTSLILAGVLVLMLLTSPVPD